MRRNVLIVAHATVARGSWALINVSTSLQPTTGFKSVFQKFPIFEGQANTQLTIFLDKVIRYVYIDFDARNAPTDDGQPYLGM